MSELQIIETALEGAARRRRWAKAMRAMWLGLLAGAVLSLLLAGVYHLWPLPLWTRYAVGLIPLPCALAGLVLGGWRKPALKEVARWVDNRLRLKERMSTALEVSVDPNGGAWRDLVVADAAAHARDLNAEQLVPFNLPKRTARWALVVLALCSGLGFVPEYRSKHVIQKENEQQAIKTAGRQLSELTRRNLEKRAPALESTQKSLEAAGELGDKLAKASLTRTDALKDLASVAEKLKDELKDLAKDPTFKRIEQAARASAGNESPSAAGLQKQIESLQKQLGTPTGKPEELDKMKKELEKLQQAAQGLSDKNSAGTEAQRQELSQALSALSHQAQEMGLQLPGLDDAIKALAESKTELFLKDLEASVTDLEKMRDMAKALQQLQQQSEKLGKDLAEQLKNGQPEAAQMTLQKMAQQLKSGNLTPEQLRQLLQEVDKAIDPASNYGQVAALLKAGAKQMQAGDKPGASQSLADAAKELEKLTQQMGDAQALMAELQALDKASWCVGNCQGWRPGNRPGLGGKGGLGGGVGTWGDDEREWNGQWTDHWDNTGMARPDTDPRGHTDRGDGELNDALRPTKVKGQFSPGSQMPSITLRNVSIKGQSKIDYEEASTAAQSDAQSALSHEQVPRAYQGAVKDYFDDLKK